LFDSNGNYRPDKKKSKENGRIDGIVATVMALSRAVAVHEPDFYASGGELVIG
jgi:phage terminase large subunit-like protein